MSAFSAKVDEHSQFFNTPLPGRLSDVFGLKTNAFYNAPQPLVIKFGAEEVKVENPFYEVLEPSTAKILARIANVDDTPPAITVNTFGKGRAIYVATPAQAPIMRALYRSLYTSLDITPGPATPDGVYARVVDGRTLYVNTTTQSRDVTLAEPMTGLLSGKHWSGVLHLAPYGVDLLQK
jgi:beta-galactosidase